MATVSGRGTMICVGSLILGKKNESFKSAKKRGTRFPAQRAKHDDVSALFVFKQLKLSNLSLSETGSNAANLANGANGVCHRTLTMAFVEKGEDKGPGVAKTNCLCDSRPFIFPPISPAAKGKGALFCSCCR
jgi:hypothetical protein